MILKSEDIFKYFPAQGNFGRNRGKTVKAVDGVSLDLTAGETLGIVGESGCGKTTLARIMMRLLAPTKGKVFFEDRDITKIKGKELRDLRRHIQIIFQDPFSSLNPRHTIERIIQEPLIVQKITPKEGFEKYSKELLDRVGLNPDHLYRYPHEFSGGQRQRIGIARALALNPKVIICDEPVSALDVSIQAQIINLLKDLQLERKISYLFIAHDLNVIKHISHRVAVMYLGKIVEIGKTNEIYNHPAHPYTKALISSAPQLDKKSDQRIVLQGDVPSPIDPPSGCRFHTRCWKAQENCKTTEPKLLDSNQKQVACFYPEI